MNEILWARKRNKTWRLKDTINHTQLKTQNVQFIKKKFKKEVTKTGALILPHYLTIFLVWISVLNSENGSHDKWGKKLHVIPQKKKSLFSWILLTEIFNICNAILWSRWDSLFVLISAFVCSRKSKLSLHTFTSSVAEKRLNARWKSILYLVSRSNFKQMKVEDYIALVLILKLKLHLWYSCSHRNYRMQPYKIF